MEFPALRGCSILVVEDEPLIGMHIRAALEDAGAHVTATTTVRHALILIEHDGLSAAIMDHALADGDSTKVCARLKTRGIPYVSYSGYDPVVGAAGDAPHVSKPGSMDELLSAVEALLVGRPQRIS
jgi:DNA-binding response OmpR family regulator